MLLNNGASLWTRFVNWMNSRRAKPDGSEESDDKASAQDNGGGIDIEKMRLFLFGGENAKSLGNDGPSRNRQKSRRSTRQQFMQMSLVDALAGKSSWNNDEDSTTQQHKKRLKTGRRSLFLMNSKIPTRTKWDSFSMIMDPEIPRGVDKESTSCVSSALEEESTASISKLSESTSPVVTRETTKKSRRESDAFRTKNSAQRPDAQKRRLVPIKVWTVPWRNWAARVDDGHDNVDDSPLALLIEAVKLTNDRSGYQSMAVQGLIDWKWTAFARGIYYTHFSIYMICLVATFVQAWSSIKLLNYRHGYAAGRTMELEYHWYQLQYAGPGRTENVFPDVCSPEHKWTTVSEVWNAQYECQKFEFIEGRNWFLAVYSLTTMRGLLFLCFELIQIHSEKLSEYISDTWNVFDVLNIALPIATNILLIIPATWDPANADTWGYAFQSLLAYCSFFCCIKLLWYVRVYSFVGPRVTMFMAILRTDLLPFLLLLGIIIVSVSMGLHVLQGPVNADFATPLRALISTWGFSIHVRGDSYGRDFGLLSLHDRNFIKDDERSFNYDTGFPIIASPQLALYELAMVLVQIVLLNLLIAIMSDTYARERERIVLTSCHLKALIIWEFEQFLMTILLNLGKIPFLPKSWRSPDGFEPAPIIQHYFPEWLHLCQPDLAEHTESSHSIEADRSHKPGADREQKTDWVATLHSREEERYRDLATKLLSLKATVSDNLRTTKDDGRKMQQGVKSRWVG